MQGRGSGAKLTGEINEKAHEGHDADVLDMEARAQSLGDAGLSSSPLPGCKKWAGPRIRRDPAPFDLGCYVRRP